MSVITIRRLAGAARGTARPALLRTLVAGMGVTAAALVVAAALSPWLSLYAGLQPIAGTDGQNGRALLALGGLLGAVAVRHFIAPGAATRWLLGLLGFVVAGYAAWLGVGLVRLVDALAGQPLLVARAEPGLLLAVTGATLALATLFVPADRAFAVATGTALRYVTGTALLIASAIHLVLAPEHLAEATWLGLAFLASAAVQLALGVALLRGALGRQRLLVLVCANSLFVATYVLSVTTGLPVASHGHDAPVSDDHGHVEEMGEAGVLTVAGELFAVAAGLMMLRGRLESDRLTAR